MASLDLSKVTVNNDFRPLSKDKDVHYHETSVNLDSVRKDSQNDINMNNVLNASISSIQYSTNSHDHD